MTQKFENISVDTKANVYFDGKVVSHTLWMSDGSKKTLGLIYPGTYHFSTGAPEHMDIVAGQCKVKITGKNTWQEIKTGQGFDVPGNSSFDISVEHSLSEYICSFM